MAAAIKTLFTVASLLLLCLGLPYVIHMERELRSMRASPINSTPATANEITTPKPETKPLPLVAIETEPETAERPSLTLPLPPAESLLEEARQRAEMDPADAMSWLQEQDPGAARLQAMLEVVALWASRDAESTLLWLESNARGIARRETLENGVTLWSESDPVAAAGWIEGMVNDGSKDIAAAALARTWGTQDALATAEWVDGITSGPTRTAAALALLESWITNNPVAATEWAAEQTVSGSSQSLEFCIAKVAESDPGAAEALLRTYGPALPQAPLLEAYIQSRAQTDPALAAAWYTELNESDPLKTNESAKILLQEWALSDSVAASAWLSEQIPGSRRDAAITGFVQSIQEHAPDAATLWSNAISQPDQRIRHLAESLESWNTRDPAAAQAWLQETELEPALRSELSLLIQN